MKIRIRLFGALREADPRGLVELDVPPQSTVAMLREALQQYLSAHAPTVSATLVARSAFASDEEILHNDRVLPEHGELALLPPVSGG